MRLTAFLIRYYFRFSFLWVMTRSDLFTAIGFWRASGSIECKAYPRCVCDRAVRVAKRYANSKGLCWSSLAALVCAHIGNETDLARPISVDAKTSVYQSSCVPASIESPNATSPSKLQILSFSNILFLFLFFTSSSGGISRSHRV